MDVRGEIAHQQRDDCSPVQSVFLFGNCQWLLVRLLGVVPFVLPHPTEGEEKAYSHKRGKSALSHVESCVIYLCFSSDSTAW